ncbi:MAG: shikimate kinase [Deltaproteobacteria bacterium HGW-Deltaproteobacteria-15]|jgi:shikimate kinase|nr:MAG: shikimate kinase [Deltaproteobacteria bacterium HGW-Deltaproteobacteria-15]
MREEVLSRFLGKAGGTFPMNVILIGYRASGKTSVGRRVAELLGYPFHDTDEIVMKAAGKTIRDIVDEGGWPLFREMEKGAIASISGKDGCVVALGGGAVLDEENIKQVNENSLFIWLKADAETVVNRMRKDGNNGAQRPPLTGGGTWKEVAELLRSREEVYRKNANFIVDTAGRSIEESCKEIVRRLRKSEGGGQENGEAREPPGR